MRRCYKHVIQNKSTLIFTLESFYFLEVKICIIPGPPGGLKCPSDLQLIDRPTENLLFATLMLDYKGQGGQESGKK